MKQTIQGQRPDQAPGAQVGSRPPKVLVAEDDADVRQLVVVALRGLGYEITEASSGADLLNQLGEALLDGNMAGRPDVIISDIRMPGLSGLKLLAGLKQARWPTAIVLMTAYADLETREEARRLGADAFFAKPFDIEDLMTVVINMASTPSGKVKARWH